MSFRSAVASVALSLANLLVWFVAVGSSNAVSAQTYDLPGSRVEFTQIASCDDRDLGDQGGLPGGTCYTAKIYGCPGETDGNTPFTARVKINQYVGQFKGDIFFMTGGGGTNWCDHVGNPPPNGWFNCGQTGTENCGLQIVTNLNTAGFTIVQTNMTEINGSQTTEPAGWLTGSANDGPRALACRYATLLKHVWSDKLNSAQPVCATGNSGGAAAVAYALTQYGLGKNNGPGPVIAFAEITSGPALGRLDHGCNVNVPQKSTPSACGPATRYTYDVDHEALPYIDPPYTGEVHTQKQTNDYCANHIVFTNPAAPVRATWWHDSVFSDDFPAPRYDTRIRALFGGQDPSAAVALGSEWFNAVGSTKSWKCVDSAGHDLPGSDAGVAQITADLIASCHQ